MAEIDYVSCKVALGGDERNIVFRSEFDPVSVPELEVLQAIHGEESVRDVEFVKTAHSTPADEKIRLIAKYTEPLVNSVFPGRNPNMGLVFADRPSKGGDASPPKKHKSATKHSAAKPFIPPDEETPESED